MLIKFLVGKFSFLIPYLALLLLKQNMNDISSIRTSQGYLVPTSFIQRGWARVCWVADSVHTANSVNPGHHEWLTAFY